MKALRSFSVRPSLPPELDPLQRLAMNLRWSWDESTRDLFRWVDPTRWDDVRHDPVRLLGTVPRERLEDLAADDSFLRYLGEVEADLARYLEQPRWFQGRAASTPLQLVAYFSPEFGISEAVPQYSGGLGILAGDHLKAASDLGVPLVGIGLMYRNGYFRQSLSLDGWQEERFPTLDPHGMALTRCDGVKVTVILEDEPCHVQVWRADVGRTALYLLDTDVEENSPACRGVTDRLYGGDTEHRLRQEIVLGVGGVRALRALEIPAQVFHTNEGHAGFLGIERVRELVEQGLDVDAALEAVRAGCVFTTHTPVPAGIDRFPRELIERYFKAHVEAAGIPFERFFELGLRADEPEEERFNMAVMGLRLAGRSNAVAELHGAVSRQMFAGLWPGVPVDEVPITSVTNGVHARTWTSPEVDDLLSRYVTPEWPMAGADDWARAGGIRDDELWRAKEQSRERLVVLVRERMRAAGLAQGLSRSDTEFTEGVLDPKVLTIGFARRFATYKRATLLLSQPERLEALLLAPDRPVQFVFAGKAHPADDKGKTLIQDVQRFGAQVHVRHRFVFVEDYDMALARALVQGSDVWLNTPRRPQEACGTSGMKAALNGSLNCSILDGWWDEWFDGDNGWAISSSEAGATGRPKPDASGDAREHVEADGERAEKLRDEREANSLFDLLERQIVPLWYARDEGPAPRRWLNKVRHNLVSLGPKVTAARMVREYVTRLYEPAAAAADRATADQHSGARALASWKAKALTGWPDVAITSVSADGEALALGETRHVEAVVALGSLFPDDVVVQLLHGPVGAGEELADVSVTDMSHAGGDPHAARYTGTFTCEVAGRYGFTVRVVPANAALAGPAELGVMTWAG